MRYEVWGSRWVDCDVRWWNSCTFVRDSSCIPSIAVLSLVYQTDGLASKSPKIIVNKELQKVGSLKTFSKFGQKVQIQNYLDSETYIQHQHNTKSSFVKDTNTTSFWITWMIRPEQIAAIQLDVFVPFLQWSVKERFGYTDKIMFINCFKLRNLR